jgi:hypothetical protein
MSCVDISSFHNIALRLYSVTKCFEGNLNQNEGRLRQSLNTKEMSFFPISCAKSKLLSNILALHQGNYRLYFSK